jgi:hypothetical protein
MTQENDPLARLQEGNPRETARFLLTLGYDHEHIVDTVAERCELDRDAARAVVSEVAAKLERESGG